MADAAVTARHTTRQMLNENFSKYKFETNESKLYNVEKAVNWLQQIERELKEVFIPGGSTTNDGALQLCNNGSSLANIKSTDMATAKSVLDHYKKKAADASTRQGTTVAPEISTRADAHEEAERINTSYQTVIGIKEAIGQAATDTFGATITDSVLRTADGTDFKSINDWSVEQLFEAIRQGADRPTTTEVHKQLNGTINFSFNFQQKIQVNYDALLATAGKLKSVGIIVGPSIRGHILLHQLELAQREEWGRDFRSCMQTLRKSYPYTHVHDDASIAAILHEMAGADAVRNLSEAPTAITEHANAVNSLMSTILRQAEEYATDDDTATEQASAVTSDSESSADKRRSRRKTRNTNNRSRSRSTRDNRSRSRGGRRDKRGKDEKLKCKHCEAVDRDPTHFGIPAEDCFFNPKHKGWKPEWVCEILEVDYVAKKKFEKE
jgi:hypothetical protein